MSHPFVIAYHLVWTVYGYWLPNDPRGSMSKVIRNDIIADLGEVHLSRKRVQPASRTIREFYQHAEGLLKHPLMTFALSNFPLIARSFEEEIALQKYTCYACAIMPDHIHMLIRKHKHQAEDMITNLQRASHLETLAGGLRDEGHPVWGGPGWKVFLDSPEEIRRTVKYIEDNPIKGRLPFQKWEFVKPYDGWPLHPGHSPNSPYARQLKGHR